MGRLASGLIDFGPVGIFILVTVILGGGAAFLTGRAIAGTWRPWWQVGALHAGAGRGRPLHALRPVRRRPLLSLPDYLLDTAVCLIFGFWGFRATRARQMAEQYGWLYRRVGPAPLGAKIRRSAKRRSAGNLADAERRFAARLRSRRTPEGGPPSIRVKQFSQRENS